MGVEQGLTPRVLFSNSFKQREKCNFLIAQVFIQLLIHVYHMTEKIMSAFTMQYKLKITDKFGCS